MLLSSRCWQGLSPKFILCHQLSLQSKGHGSLAVPSFLDRNYSRGPGRIPSRAWILRLASLAGRTNASAPTRITQPLPAPALLRSLRAETSPLPPAVLD